MSNPRVAATPRGALFGRRNVLFLAAAVLVLVVGYLLLKAGSADAGAALLVLGYCILFPLGLALS
ncbi:MAG TPA: hypothetical protein VFS40_02720 [Gemmatimonadales bacterium]|nr:hypothetical protein [Gemmatimonadales bacterium]